MDITILSSRKWSIVGPGGWVVASINRFRGRFQLLAQ
jgi:hypothetical protein